MSQIAHLPIRWSSLSRFEQSPAHALHAALHGSDPTPAMKLGSAAHAAAFEPHRLRIYTGKTRRGKEWDAFKVAQPADAVIVNVREHTIAQHVAAALRAADVARVDLDGVTPLPLLFGRGVEVERNIQWTRHGRACSSTPDARLPGQWVADLKCARSGQPSRFVRTATWAGYHTQLAFYQEADAAELGLPAPQARLFSVVVEPFAPYVVTTYELDAYAIAAGAQKITEWWNRLRDCEATDHWPGYVQTIATFTADDPELAAGPLGGFEADEPANDGDADKEPQQIDWSAA